MEHSCAIDCHCMDHRWPAVVPLHKVAISRDRLDGSQCCTLLYSCITDLARLSSARAFLAPRCQKIKATVDLTSMPPSLTTLRSIMHSIYGPHPGELRVLHFTISSQAAHQPLPMSAFITLLLYTPMSEYCTVHTSIQTLHLDLSRLTCTREHMFWPPLPTMKLRHASLDRMRLTFSECHMWLADLYHILDLIMMYTQLSVLHFDFQKTANLDAKWIQAMCICFDGRLPRLQYIGLDLSHCHIGDDTLDRLTELTRLALTQNVTTVDINLTDTMVTASGISNFMYRVNENELQKQRVTITLHLADCDGVSPAMTL